MKKLLLFLIGIYRRYISPMKPPCCRFTPTCSSYAVEAVERYGALRGGFLALKRILKCHPFHKAGYDPVPCSCAHGSGIHHQHVEENS